MSRSAASYVEAAMRLARRALPLAALVLVTLASAARAHMVAGDHDGVYVLRVLTDVPGRGRSRVETPRGPRYADVGPKVVPEAATLFAVDNTNTRFQLFVRAARARACGEGILRLHDRFFPTTSYGGDASGCTYAFELDSTWASLASLGLHVPRQDRNPHGEQVTATFAASSARYERGQRVEVAITITNPIGAPTVGRVQGGRQRGPRDNQFAFVVRRDGQALPIREGPDFGGPMGIVPMAPGARAVLVAELAAWADVSVPGTYEVDCAYETSFAPEGVSPFEDAHRGAIWDRRFTGTVRFVVR